tara:strand:- start:1379 stop:2866 length:1488 start_codon:yes stop_codon:yes gene_type:complete
MRYFKSLILLLLKFSVIFNSNNTYALKGKKQVLEDRFSPSELCREAIQQRLDNNEYGVTERTCQWLAVAKSRPGDSKGIRFFEEYLKSDKVEKDLRSLLDSLKTTEDADSYQEHFFNALGKNELAQKNLEFLRKNNIPLEFKKTEENPDCRGSQGLAYQSPTIKIVMCTSKEGRSHGEITNTFNHEVLHIKQYMGIDVTHDCTFDTSQNDQYISKRSLSYSYNQEYFSDVTKVQRVDLSKEESEAYQETSQLLNQMEQFFYVGISENGEIQLTPKKPSNVSEREFFDTIVERYNFFNHPEPTDDNYSEFVILKMSNRDLYSSLIDTNSSDIKNLNDLKKLFQKKGTESYKNLISNISPEKKGPMNTQIKELYMTKNRLLHPFKLYCTENQANMQSEWNKYFRWLSLTNIKGCDSYREVLNGKYPPGQNIFSRKFYEDNGFNFELIDSLIEKSINTSVSKSYGNSFSPIYGFKGFDEIFNTENCNNFNPDILNYQP